MVVLQLLAVSALSSVTASPPEEYYNTSGCPLWHYRHSSNSTECTCGYDWNRLIFCQNGHLFLRESFLVGTMSRGGPDAPSSVQVIGESWFVFLNDSSIASKMYRGYYKLPNTANETELNDRLCQPNNRKGFLCQECLPDYGPNAYHPICSKCDLSVLPALALYLLSKIVPVALWFGLIITFRIDLSQGPLIGYMIFCQLYVFLVREENRLYLPQPYQLLEYSSFVLASVWSLDMFHIAHILKPFCISPHLKVWDIILLNFISVLAPLLLAVITYFIIELYSRYCTCKCWMPLCHCFSLVRNWSATDSLIHAYASLYMLGFPLLNYNAYKFFKVTNLYSPMREIVKRNILILDPTMHVYSNEMIFYFVIVISLLFLLGVIPSFLILLYPNKIFRGRLEKCCSRRCVIGLNTFIETFQGPYKNGCNGTRDFRIVPGLVGCLVLLYTMFCSLHYVISHEPTYLLLSLSTALAVVSVLCAYLRPCKSSIANLSLTFHCIWMAGFAMIIALWNIAPSVQSSVLVVLIGIGSPLPHVLMIGWIVYTLDTKVFHLRQRCVACFKLFLVGTTLFGNRVNAEPLPDRLMNSHQYREML